MLNKRRPSARAPRAARQRGMVLLVALVVLVAMMVAGIAMMRSVDTSTLVAGNLAFQQAATNAADQGVEQAIAMLQQKKTDGTLDSNDPSSGYEATLIAHNDNPLPGQTWQQFWSGVTPYHVGPDQFGNDIYYVVNRACSSALPPGSGGQCVESPAITTSANNSNEAGEIQLSSSSQIYYRITVRVSGPRKTESYVQTYIAM